LGLSFFGVLLIVRPGSELFSWAALLPLSSALFYALYQILTRRVAADDHAFTSWFLSALVAFSSICLVAPFFWKWPQSLADWGLFFLTGLFGGIGHLFLTKAYQYAQASTLAPFVYLQLAFALLAGWLIFGAWPDSLAMLGMGFIVATGMVLAVLRHREWRGETK
jgi:drug/metabolite transporter (DMT)-like permease